MEGIPTGQVWNNLGIKVNNFGISIQYSNPLHKIGMVELIQIWINTWWEGKALPYIRMPIDKYRKEIKLENYHLATIIIINDLGKNHQWVLNPVGENLMRNQCLRGFNVSPHKCLLTDKYTILIIEFTVEKLGWHDPNQLIKVNVLETGWINIFCLFGDEPRTQHHFCSIPDENA